MKIGQQDNTALADLRAEVQALKKKQEELALKRYHDLPKAKKTSSYFSVIPLLIGVLFAILTHVYYNPVGFYEHLITSAVILLLVIGGAFLSLVVYDKLK